MPTKARYNDTPIHPHTNEHTTMENNIQQNASSAPANAMQEGLSIEERAVELLRTVYDPEIPVNVYDLGLIYRIELKEENTALEVDMTLTAPNCPAADFIVEDVRQKLENIGGLTRVDVNLVFEPEWSKDMMTEEAKMELGFL